MYVGPKLMWVVAEPLDKTLDLVGYNWVRVLDSSWCEKWLNKTTLLFMSLPILEELQGVVPPHPKIQLSVRHAH